MGIFLTPGDKGETASPSVKGRPTRIPAAEGRRFLARRDRWQRCERKEHRIIDVALPVRRAELFARTEWAEAVMGVLLAGLSSGLTHAMPTGGVVTEGSAIIGQSRANLTVTQTAQRTAINWQSFGIAAHEAVRFNQPSASSVVLNRVLGQDAQIFGSLSANGQVFLLNPNGVLFGAGAQVNVGGLVASSLNLTDQDFLAGRYSFTKGATAGSVINQGTIDAASGGYVALLGSQVKNEGTITSNFGTVALGAGDQVTLNLNGNSLVSLTVAKEAVDALVENKQLIRADGGQVLMSAKALDQLIRSVVNNIGIIEANTLSNVNGVIRLEGGMVNNAGTIRAKGSGAENGGKIILRAGQDLSLEATSLITANGAHGGAVSVQTETGTLLADGRIEVKGADATGGSVRLLGERVGLINAASVDASGRTGGGEILVGGDYQGENPDVQNSSRSYVGPGTSLKADAIEAGGGGRVIVWANELTHFKGSISARGGAMAGNGGFVETSGKDHLEAIGSVDASAPAGTAGLWLLDPANVTIVNAASGNGMFDGGSPNIFSPTADTAVADRNAIQTSLNAGTSVTINTAGAGPGPETSRFRTQLPKPPIPVHRHSRLMRAEAYL